MKLWLILLMISGQTFADPTNPDLPDPQTLTRKYLEELSQREVGQKKFVIKDRNWRSPRMEQQEQQQQQDGGSREIQEADVYKIGKKDKKELFLLNNYRGFQVVSFKDGIERPELLSRIPIYNNWSSEMYYLEKQDQVLILNTEWSYSFNYWQTNYNTSVYLIDVSDTSHPKVVKETSVPGYLQNSRLVGDVLYTITNNNSWGNDGKAMITSMKFNEGMIEEVDRHELHGENRWVRTMNVVQSGEKYYVMSTLSNFNGGDHVSVHDISSKKGTIQKVLTAKVRGNISERSQTFMHKGHLFAVSNYNSESNIMRISVEAFALKKSEQVVESLPNMRVSVGDTNGLHASLQDVRVSGDMLYAFWVPANNIDPFELFDISNPSAGIKHLGQLQFEGWINKAFPIEYQNRKFVLGLGWVVPATMENNRRYPQAKLFEIKNINGTIKHEVVTSLTLNSEEFWGNFNDEDKYFEMLQEEPGVYNILFPVTFMKTWKNGAKVVNLNINASKLTEGASVVGDQGWLRRVFVNKEIRGVHAFGDMQLESFNQSDISVNGIAETVSVLELARNVIDFHVLSAEEGLQIIHGEKQVELRTVSLKNTDAEKTDVTATTTIKGNYEWHKIIGQKLHVITSVYKQRINSGSEYYWDRKFDYANLTTIDLPSGKKISKRIELAAAASDEHFWFNVQNITSAKEEIFTISGQMFILADNDLRKLAVNEECQYFFKTQNLVLQSLGDEIIAYNEFDVLPVDGNENQQQGSFTYSFPFYKQLNFNNGVVDCSQSLNLPGKPVLKTDKTLIASENGEQNYYPYYEHGMEKGISYSYDPIGRSNNAKTYSLRMTDAGELELMDVLNKNITAGLIGNNFITFNDSESRVDLWSINQEGQFMSRPQYLDYDEHKDVSLVTIQKFNNRNFIFMKNKKLIDVYELSRKNQLTKLPVTSSFDSQKTDDSAENIFEMKTVKMSADQSRFYISQGLFGMTDIILK